ncbi:MAG: hypothetical protein ABSF53_14120 [Terracidiphilus sp.]
MDKVALLLTSVLLVLSLPQSPNGQRAPIPAPDPAPEPRAEVQTNAGGGSNPATSGADSRQMQVGGGTLQIDFAPGPLDLPRTAILSHIEAAADAVSTYFGGFPVKRIRMLVVPVAGGRDGIHGTTWGDAGGFQGFTRLRVDEHTTAADLDDDWVTTHELTHMAFPSLPRDQHWMEEGMATYIEPIARVETGELKAQQIWSDMVHGMPHGEPAPGDEGLDHTHTWGRTYWGGGLFCLVADVEIRRQTSNRMGLQDAMRAIVAEGGTIDHEWPLDKALEIGDRATGTHVLTRQYAAWKDSPTPVDLVKLWAELGVRSTPGGGIEFLPNAPLAGVREAITANPKHAQAVKPAH